MHEIDKLASSSMVDALQIQQQRSFEGVLGLVNLPLSLAKGRLQKLLNRVKMQQ